MDIFALDRPFRAYLDSLFFNLFGVHAPLYSHIAFLARLLAILLFGLMVVLVSGGIYVCTRQAPLAMLLGAVVAVSPVLVPLFSAAMAEGLFFVTGFSAMLLLLAHLEKPRRAWLVAAGLLAGLSFLARFTGLAWIATGCLALLAFRRANWKTRLMDCSWLAVPAGAPSALWVVPLSLTSSSVTSRNFQFTLSLGPEFQQTNATLIDMGWGWIPFSDLLFPTRSYFLRGVLMLSALGLLGLLALLAVWRRPRLHSPDPLEGRLFRLAGVFALFSGFYLVLVVFSYLFAYPRSDLNGRVLSPFYFAGLLILVALPRWIALGLGRWPGRILAGLSLLVPLVFIVNGVRQSVKIVQNYPANGEGYTSPAWRCSLAIQAVREVEPGLELISNESAVILFLTNRPAYDVAEICRSAPLETYPCYGDDPNDTAQSLFRQRKAALVIFQTLFYWQLFPLYGEHTTERIQAMLNDLDPIRRLKNGTIYLYPVP